MSLAWDYFIKDLHFPLYTKILLNLNGIENSYNLYDDNYTI